MNIFKNVLKVVRASLLVLMGSGIMAVHADELYVIANPSVDLAADDLRDVYLGEKLLAGGVKLVPVDNTAAQAKFLSKVMGMDQAKYESLWSKKGFRDGLQAPASKATDVEVIAYVRRIPGAIGYVGSVTEATGIKLIKKY